jgi:di- and tripeptidase
MSGKQAVDVADQQESIGHIDTILLSNSTWINEENPCVVYGMRGVVYANLTISSGGADAHSGVDGGMVAEPMFDMVRVLGGIGDAKGVKLPEFCKLVASFEIET